MTDDIVNQYTHHYRFIKDLKFFHRLNDEYFKIDTELKYEGDIISIEYKGINGDAKIARKESFAEKRYNSKLCYIPAERNLVSAIQNVDKTYKATGWDVLFNFIDEWNEAKEPYTNEHPFKLAATGGFSYVNKFGADMLVREDGTETPAFHNHAQPIHYVGGERTFIRGHGRREKTEAECDRRKLHLASGFHLWLLY